MGKKKDLNAAAQKATMGFFTDGPEEGASAAETIEKETTTSIQSKQAPKKKSVAKKGFSFRGDPEDVLRWQNYGMAVKSTHAPAEKFRVDEIWCVAIEEYIDRHPLSGKAKELYDEYTKA